MRRACVTEFVPQHHERSPRDRCWTSTTFLMAMLFVALAAALWAASGMLGLTIDA